MLGAHFITIIGDKGGIFLSCSTAVYSQWVGFVEQPCILCGWGYVAQPRNFVDTAEMAALFGQVGEFDASKESCTQYT